MNVVEGGDDSGNDATQIGRCVVSGLPPGLPAKTPVEVTFQYESNGQLGVDARVPSADKRAHLEIKRSTGLADDEIEHWSKRIQLGLDLSGKSESGAPPPETVTPAGDGEVVDPSIGGNRVTAIESPAVDAPTAPETGGWKSRRAKVTAGDEDPTT